MPIPKYAAKRDIVEDEIVSALRSAGASVIQLSQPGVPDLLVSFRDTIYLMEVKARYGKLTPAQLKFKELWPHPVLVCKTLEAALQAIGAL